MRLILCFILSFSCIGITIAQSIPSKNITVNDGLPSNNIKCFFKDSRGYMWFGTEAGLCRYDGKNIKTFTELNQLKTNQIWDIVEDKFGNLWISIYGLGLAKYDGKSFKYYTQKDGLVDNRIRKIYYSKKFDYLVLGTEDGLSIFNKKKFKSFKKKTVINHFQVVGIDGYLDKIMLTISYDNNYQLELNKNIQKSKLVKIFKPLFSYSSFIDKNTYYGGGTGHFLFMRNLKTHKEKTFACPILWDFQKDNANNLYGAGWNVTDPNGGLFKYSKQTLQNVTSTFQIKSTGLWCLYFDKSFNQLWVGSIDNGIYINDLSDKMKLYTSTYFGEKELNLQELFIDDNQTIWMGAKDYLISMTKEKKTKLLDKTKLRNKVVNFIKSKYAKFSLDTILTAKKAENGFTTFNIHSDVFHKIWFNTTWGIMCFDEKFNLLNFFPSDGGHSIITKNNSLYYGNMYGIMFKYNNAMNLKTYEHIHLKNKNIPRDIKKTFSTKNQHWFASSSNGLYLLENGHFTSFMWNGLFMEKNINDILVNTRNELVIGTNSGIVYITRWNGKKLMIKNVLKPDKELFGTSISFIEYAKGTYFIGTNKGINIVRNNRFVKLINQSEGLADNQFNDAVFDKKNTLWITSSKGLIELNVDKLIVSPLRKNRNIKITSLEVNGEKSKFHTISNWGRIVSNHMQLPYNKNNIIVNFTSTNLYNSDKHVFRYKINGLSKVWTSYTQENNLRLYGIPFGNYDLIIEGKNLGTGESFKPLHFHIEITPPFWKTTWFITLVLLILITLAYLIIRYRIRIIEHREREKAEVTNKLTETKLEALRAQMNPHFTFNAMNSIQNYIIDNDTTNALHYLGEFSKLIRQTLENASEKLMSLETEIRFLESYMNVQKMRFDRVTTSIKMDNSIDKYRTLIPPLILQPFIENAFEHAFENDSDKQQTIDIYFFIDAGKLICTIRDNGIGFQEGATNSFHKSFGQKLTKDRLDLLNREFETRDFNYEITNLKILDSNLSGTQVRIAFLLLLE